ncbi:MAG: hypothetical protein JO225_02075 [Candidatus Eremiobacteraeota bacterium]|nr:hypothetical protein [Candidatus Eremiobacteraeota bacterium]MBV8642686.1 hypothetical protein [Candidatus Eremiobacteraeota bacterium]
MPKLGSRSTLLLDAVAAVIVGVAAVAFPLIALALAVVALLILMLRTPERGA